MIRIVADDKIPFLRGVLDGYATVKFMPGKEISSGDVKNADALLIRTRTRCDKSLLEGSSVRFIASATIGFDHIDTDYCKKAGITWTNAPGCNSSSVEQYIVSALLELVSGFHYSLKDKTIGIVGVGNVGSKVARVAKVLGLNVLLNDPPRERAEGSEQFVSIKRIKEEADIISFHTPLNNEGIDKTYHLADHEFFSELSKPVVLINASRGEVVDGNVLSQAIDKGIVMHTVLDVWENEPGIDKGLLEKVQISTAHIAGYSTDGKMNGSLMSVRALSRFFNLGLDTWKPENIPAPDQEKIIVDCSGMDIHGILHEVYNRCYSIMEDDKLLRENPGSFEQLRGNYHVRREATSFCVRLNNNPYEELGQILEMLGFSILELDCFC